MNRLYVTVFGITMIPKNIDSNIKPIFAYLLENLTECSE